MSKQHHLIITFVDGTTVTYDNVTYSYPQHGWLSVRFSGSDEELYFSGMHIKNFTVKPYTEQEVKLAGWK